MSLRYDNITGSLGKDTPRCILMLIAKSHGIEFDPSKFSNIEYRQALTKLMRTIPPLNVNESKIESELSLIARFVNPGEKAWKKDSLLTAYHFINSFANCTSFQRKIELLEDAVVEDTHKGYYLGPPTNNHPKSLHPVILYRLCRDRNINISNETSLHVMYSTFMLTILPSDVLETYGKNNSKTQQIFRYINGIGGISGSGYKQCLDEKITHESIRNTKLKINSMNRSGRAPLPVNDNEAIVIAFVVWNINLYIANSPLLEFYNVYRQYKNIKGDLRKLSFVDTGIIRLAKLNIGRLSNKIYFDKNFPEELYSQSILQNLARENGLNLLRGNIYNRLFFRSLLELFYQGKHPESEEDVTFINREELDEIPNEKIISYGILGENIYHMTLSEIALTFQTNKNFSNPFIPNEILSKRAIKSLKKICQKIQDTNNRSGTHLYDDETIEESRALVRSMDFVMVISTEKYQDVSNFFRTYRSFDNHIKENIQKCLLVLLETGMYMRTWKGPGEGYPLAECPIDDQDLIDDNVITSVRSFNDEYDQLREHVDIKSLPLFKFSSVGNTFEVSTDTFNGLTIGDRLEIFLGGENERRISSCMRITSNWIVSTAYYYLNGIGKHPGFDISALAMIA